MFNLIFRSNYFPCPCNLCSGKLWLSFLYQHYYIGP
uniref:Uncharacterized protein n=1 Tax=Anguilla anguilla TaxID=7936 RepID=A0A0E9RWJ2_ANGAN